jgi:hypothetical protein
MNYETGYDGWGWVPEWVVQVAVLRTPVETVVPAAIAFVSMLWLGWRAFKGRPIGDPHRGVESSAATFAALLLAAAYVGAIVLWFVMAPSPRFGGFALWGLAAIGVGMVSRTLPDAWTIRYRKLILAAVCGLVLLPMFDEAARVELRHRFKPDHVMFGKHFYHFYPVVWPTGQGGFPPVPKGETVTMTTDSGLVVYLGAPQKDGYPALLWDAPLPAARFFKPGLALRRPGDMRGGFKINSSPNPPNGPAHDR